MAKRRRSKSLTYYGVQRRPDKRRSAIAARERDFGISPITRRFPRSRLLPVVPIQDRRLYTPISAPPRHTTGQKAQIIPARWRKRSVSPFLAFKAPKSVTLCVRRKRRREVLHAHQVAGRRGIGRGKRRRTNEYSEVKC